MHKIRVLFAVLNLWIEGMNIQYFWLIKVREQVRIKPRETQLELGSSNFHWDQASFWSQKRWSSAMSSVSVTMSCPQLKVPWILKVCQFARTTVLQVLMGGNTIRMVITHFLSISEAICWNGSLIFYELGVSLQWSVAY